MENLKRLMQRQKSLPEGSKESKQTIHTLEDSNLQYEFNRKDGNKPSLYNPSIGSHYMKHEENLHDSLRLDGTESEGNFLANTLQMPSGHGLMKVEPDFQFINHNPFEKEDSLNSECMEPKPFDGKNAIPTGGAYGLSNLQNNQYKERSVSTPSSLDCNKISTECGTLT